MKNKILLFFALIGALVLTSCGSETEYAKFIPKEAAVVGRIDVAQISEKGNFSNNEKLMEIIKKAVNESGLTAKGKVAANKIVDDPKATGIDLRKPVFYYYSNDSNGDHFGIIASVLNENDLKDFVNYLSKENGGETTKEYNGVTYMGDSDDMILAFTDHWFVIKDMESDKVEDVISALLAREDLKPEMTIETDAGYQRMLEEDGLAQLVVRGGMLAKIMSGTNNRFNIDEAYKKMADFDYIFDLESDKGELNLDMETFASTDEGRRKLTENKKYLDEIQGNYADYINKDALFTLMANIHGKEICKALEDANFPNMQDAKPYLEAINGDVVYTLNTVKANLNDLDMRVFAHLSDAAPYLQWKSMIESESSIKNFAENEYSLSLGQIAPIPDLASEVGLADENAPQNNGNIMLNFGVNNNSNLYIATSVNSNAFDKVTSPLGKDNLKGRSVYLRFNSTNALDIIKLTAKNQGTDQGYEFKLGMHLLGLIDYMELYSTTDLKGKFRVVMRDKEKSALETLCGEIATIVNIFG